MRISGAPETGTNLVSSCISSTFNLDFVEADPSMVTGSDAKVTHGIGNRNFGFIGEMVASSAAVAFESLIMKEVLLILCRHIWVVQNCFSPLSNLGNGVEAEFGEREDHDEAFDAGSEQRGSHHDDTT